MAKRPRKTTKQHIFEDESLSRQLDRAAVGPDIMIPSSARMLEHCFVPVTHDSRTLLPENVFGDRRDEPDGLGNDCKE